MRSVWLVLALGLLGACASVGAPVLTEVSAWEPGAADDGSLMRLEVLDVPRNADVTLRALSAQAPGLVTGAPQGRVQVVLRAHTEDGGAVSWHLLPAAPATAPLRAMALTGLDVVVGTTARLEGVRLTGPSILAEMPVLGPRDPAGSRRLAESVAESGGTLWLAARLPVRSVEEGAPGRWTRRLVLSGVLEAEGRRLPEPVVVELEIGVEVVDRAYRPEERHKRRYDEQEDPVRQPRPRELTLRF